MELIPPGMATMEGAARRLDISMRGMRALVARTPLAETHPVSLGRSLGTYRLLPQLGLCVLRQLQARSPYRLMSWQAALEDVLCSATWRQANASLAEGTAVRRGASGRAAVEELLLSPHLRPAMEALHAESAAALARHDLDDLVQTEEMVVDRLDDDEAAVALVGAAQRAYLLPRTLLRVAGLDREKAWGILTATHTSSGIELDVWPSVGVGDGSEWQPDPLLMAQRVEVGA